MAVLHDAGKIVRPEELVGSGSAHEAAGERLLLAHGVPAELAHCCRSHAAWRELECSLDELLVALADTLWKGAREPELELVVIDRVAKQLGKDRWGVFVHLDTAFEEIAADGTARLARGR